MGDSPASTGAAPPAASTGRRWAWGLLLVRLLGVLLVVLTAAFAVLTERIVVGGGIHLTI
jgi:hypothetical protein